MLCELRRQLKGAMLYTRRPLAGARAGQFRVRARGSGSDLDQLRDYQPGDDVRFIDWKSSARVQRVVVRDYRDERSRTVHLICDTSRSMDFGIGARRVCDCATELATGIAVLCENAGDACGLFLAYDQLCERISPAIGMQQTGRIATALTSAYGERPVARHSCGLSAWCAQVGRQNMRSSILFVISDFIDDADAELMHYAAPLAQHHLLIAVRVRDESERYPQLVGRRWLLRDSEVSSDVRADVRLETMHGCIEAAQRLAAWRREQESALRRGGFQLLDCFTGGAIGEQLCLGLRRCGLFVGRK